jgi:hypothetical protein
VTSATSNTATALKLALLRRFFFTRTDRVAFRPPWDADACPCEGADLDAMLAAHLDAEAPEVTLRWWKGEKKTGTVHGRFRLGTYCPGTDGLTLFACVDFDGGGHKSPLQDPLGAALALVEVLKNLGLTAHLERSKNGKGWHVWIFFAEKVSAAKIRKLLFAVMPKALLANGKPANAKRNQGIEIFPKQDKAPVVGNQVFLPWYFGAVPGGNEFCRVDSSGEIVQYQPTDFATVTVEGLDAALAAVPDPPKSITRKATSTNGSCNGKPTTDYLLKRALDRASPGNEDGRNDSGLWLACQLRDNGYTETEAEPVMKDYAKDVSQQPHPYTEGEAMASLRQAYSRSAREPWEARQRIAFTSAPMNERPAVHENNGHTEASKEQEEQRAEEVPEAPSEPPPDDPAPPPQPAPERGTEGQPFGRLVNFENIEVAEKDGEGNPKKDEDGNDKKKTIRVGLAASVVVERLQEATGGWPKRVGDRLFVAQCGKALWLDASDAFFAWAGRVLNKGGFVNVIDWRKGGQLPTRAELFASACQTVQQFDSVEELPHWPPIPKVYYLHPTLPAGDGAALKRLLNFFCPASDRDADCVLALSLTPFAGLPPGQRPAVMVEAEPGDDQGGRGAGKSKLVQMVARVAGGHVEVRPNEDINDVVTRLLSPAAADKRVGLLDNVKTLKLSHADLEALITSDVISGRQMYVGEGQRPNYLTWCLTFNGASMSRDMAQRTVPIRLKRPRHEPTWEAEVLAFIDAHRWEIIADVITELRRPVPALAKFSRWSGWEAAVLSRVGDPAAAQKLIAERQESIDDDHAEADVVRDYFVRELQARRHNPDADGIFIPTRTAAIWVNGATGEKYPTNRASSYLRTLAIKELRKSADDGQRGWAWRGKDFPADQKLEKLGDAPPFHMRAEGEPESYRFPDN